MHAFKSYKPCFSKALEALYAINMRLAVHKLITPMIHPKVFFISHINQAVVTTPPVRVNNTIKTYSSSNNPLQRSFRAVWNYLSVYLPIASENPKIRKNL